MTATASSPLRPESAQALTGAEASLDPMNLLNYQGMAGDAADVLTAYSVAQGYPLDFAAQLREYADHGPYRPGPTGGRLRIEDRMRVDGGRVIEALDWVSKQTDAEGGISPETIKRALSVKAGLLAMNSQAQVEEIVAAPPLKFQERVKAIGVRAVSIFK